MTGAAVRILVTGSRSWTEAWVIKSAIRDVVRAGMSVTVVHGGARGADRIAGDVARSLGFIEEVHVPDWSTGKAAGIRRNLAMIDAGADVCLAFIRDGSRGATHCADAAEKAGIPTRRFIA